MAQVEVNKTEAWRILDALQVYKKDYELTEYALKNIRNVEKKLKKIVNS
tara:strand:+ start:159 stop:305 length:147 start_codon:yes stop_codon:yes gene_type:complete